MHEYGQAVRASIELRTPRAPAAEAILPGHFERMIVSTDTFAGLALTLLVLKQLFGEPEAARGDHRTAWAVQIIVKQIKAAAAAELK
jgi:hypothetical protein